MTTAQKIQRLQQIKRKEATAEPLIHENLTLLEQYKEVTTDIENRLKNINSKVKQHNKKFDGKNYGYLGDLNHINNLLMQIQEFM